MSSPRRCGWCRIGPIPCLYITVVFSVATLVVQSASLSTNFSFPVFPSTDDFITFGQTLYNPGTHSFTINPNPSEPLNTTRLNCVKMFYKEKVRMKSEESSAVASFSTSFSFSITQRDQSTSRSGWLSYSYGFMLTFGSEYHFALFAGNADMSTKVNELKYLAIEIDTYNDFLSEDPSDNHIGVNINGIKSAYTYNLCEGNRASCSFPWTGRNYTAWIEYNASTTSLDVWCANGSLREGVTKPAGSSIIHVPTLDLMDIFEDYMYVGFSGNVWPLLDTHEILSWNFVSKFSEAMPSPRGFSIRVLIIYAACVPGILAAICLLGYWRIRRPRIDKSELGLQLELLIGLRRFSFKELKKATKNFNKSALLGKGGFGSVFKGTLPVSGMLVAVKRLEQGSEHVQKEFVAEVSSISQIRHRNLVHLQGWCHENGHFLLVFDYMSNGSLDEWLFPSRRRYPLDLKYKRFGVFPWELRFSILAGVAAAVEYLHEEWVQCVLHRGIKSSNVMLDVDFSPHLGDFGLARLMDHEKLEKTTMMAGTFGYMAPEMHYTGKATKEADVYSFGILMLEVLCGRRPVDLRVEYPDENFLLVQNVWRAREDGNILLAVDPGLLNLQLEQGILLTNPKHCEAKPVDEFSSNTISYVKAGATFNAGDEKWKTVPLLQLGLQCSLSDLESRPSMRVVKQVIQQLQGSTAKDATATLSLMPPLPSTMAIYGPMRSDSMSMLRQRRLQSR